MSNQHSVALADWFDRLKRDIDLHDLADRLGLKRQGVKGNYHSPHHDDKSASVSVFKEGRMWKDWSGHTEGGTCIDLVMYCNGAESPIDAAKLLGQWYGIPMPAAQPVGAKNEPERKSTVEYIADRCLKDAEPAIAYLAGRKIRDDVARRALSQRAIGWNTWRSDKVRAGQPGHGGPAAAFIVRTASGAQIVAVDLRYVDAQANGNVKTQCQGEKLGHGWTSERRRLERAHTVYVVESPINALSVECAHLPAGTAAYAMRGIGNVDATDWSFLRGKNVRIALDHADPINERTGERPGLVAAWRLSEILTAQDISSLLVDMHDWDEGEDINDVLVKHGEDELTRRLRRLEAWLIPGMPSGGASERLNGTRRVFLPGHDFGVYWRYRVKDDFTQYVAKFKESEEEGGERSEDLEDMCSFRVAGFSRLRVQSHLATLSGQPDTQPETVFGVSAQVPRHGATLQREVVTDERLYNLEWWRAKFGQVWMPQQFTRMITVLERTAHLGARDVVNFVGLAWRDGTPAALEGKDCYFMEPTKQCLYYNMQFPRGPRDSAANVIQAYQATFHDNAAALALVWGLGAHLKAILGFYPHLQMQAEKGSGKSKLLERLQATLAFQVLSGQMLKTDHRRRASVSYTTQPVGWDEISKLPKTVLSEIDGMLQNIYRFEFTRVGATMTPYLMCAPVLLAGEEVDVESLQSKMCRTSISVARQGTMLPHDLPQFPVWEWLQFLAGQQPERIRELHAKCLAGCVRRARSEEKDATAMRMLENYAAVLTAWMLVCEFAGIDSQQGGFIDSVVTEMNTHIADTSGTRLPWVWIMEIVLSEIEARRFLFPYTFDRVVDDDGQDQMALFLRPNHVMDHLSTAPHLRAKFDGLPIKTGRIFKEQLMKSGVVATAGGRPMDEVEKRIRGQRAARLTAIRLDKLAQLGLYVTPELVGEDPPA
ncbi:toprim domain-containing protein [Achromobacter xylosoxidans]